MHDDKYPEGSPLVTGAPVDARTGYDLAARNYDSWSWQEFWEKNETPVIEQTLRSLTSARILDIGVGTGRYFQLIRSMGHEVYGIDVSAEMLAVAAKRFDRSSFEPYLREGDVRSIPFYRQLFDCILCCRVLSHVDDISLALSEMLRVLRRGGVALITDVDGRHRYDATRIPVQGKDVLIRIYKHTLEEVVNAASDVGFVVEEARLVHANDLHWRPPERDFPKIDWSGRTPISYQVALRKRS